MVMVSGTYIRGEREYEVPDSESHSGLTVGCTCIFTVTIETCVGLR